MSNNDYQIFTTIARMDQKTLLRFMLKFLKKYYPKNKVIVTTNYILCEGNVPIMLVAHMDTVFKSLPEKIYYDQKQHVMWSPSGLGADDRAGVFAIIKILQKGFRPHICLTTDEEKGGIGANILIKNIPNCPYDIKYIIQLDRQGTCDCVFYSCANEQFQEYVESFNFITDWGTFSDISIICPAWKIAGVNLSVGYFDEHSFTETLHTDALYSTIQKVSLMIQKIESADYFEYVASPYDLYWGKVSGKYFYPFGWDNYNYAVPTSDGPYKCESCKNNFQEEDVIPVKTQSGNPKTAFYCVDCVSSKINWCERCGEAFEIKNVNDIYCPDCEKEKKNKIPVM